MNYLEWNNVLGEFFFNSKKAEKEVYLFITKQDIINIGKEKMSEYRDENIFLDYISSMRHGLLGDLSSGNILDHALYAYSKWKDNSIIIDKTEITYPFYIGYLVLFVLPLTEKDSSALRVDAYYPRVREFLKKYELPSLPTLNEYSNWNKLWIDLEEWSILEKNTELGSFELHPFSNSRWIYVGKPLSQCLFPRSAINALPIIFDKMGLVPGEQVLITNFRAIVKKYGLSMLGLKAGVIKSMSEDKNELAESILKIIEKFYNNWKGETNIFNEETKITKKGFTTAHLRFCLIPDFANGSAQTFFRLYSPMDYPEDLRFEDKYDCRLQNNGLSKPMQIPFRQELVLKDDFNKWKAIIPKKDIRILIKGDNFHVAGWVEVPQMNVCSQMLLFVHKEISKSIKDWGFLMENSEFSEVNLVGLPVDYNTFLLKNPTIEHPDIPQLSFKSNKQIKIIGGLKVRIRTFLPDFLPEIVLENGRGDEKLFLSPDSGVTRIDLVRKDIERPIWGLPPSINFDRKYQIFVEGLNLQQNPGITITSYVAAGHLLQNSTLPRRNEFGEILSQEQNSIQKYSIGSQVVRTTSEANRPFHLRHGIYDLYFCPQTTKANDRILMTSEDNYLNNVLLFFLSTKGETTLEQFREAFDNIYYNIFKIEEIENHMEISRLKRASLNLFDYMGYLDYEYKSGKIIVNPPQLIPLPADTGRKALLIGGRTPELIAKVRDVTEKIGYSFNQQPQDQSARPFLLPNTITISGHSDLGGLDIERNFKYISDKCLLDYQPNEYSQFTLAEFSGKIEEYKNTIIPDFNFNDQGWSCRVFNPELLWFIRSSQGELDKKYSLVEYKLNEYTFEYRIWINNIPYHVNKNWGRYMVLERNKKNVILFSRIDTSLDIVLIPSTLPLPRLLAEAFILFSGQAPQQKKIESKGTLRWYNIYKNIPHIFAHNYLMKVGQKLVETNLLELCEIQ